jgi:hypothetical protein
MQGRKKRPKQYVTKTSKIEDVLDQLNRYKVSVCIN